MYKRHWVVGAMLYLFVCLSTSDPRKQVRVGVLHNEDLTDASQSRMEKALRKMHSLATDGDVDVIWRHTATMSYSGLNQTVLQMKALSIAGIVSFSLPRSLETRLERMVSRGCLEHVAVDEEESYKGYSHANKIHLKAYNEFRFQFIENLVSQMRWKYIGWVSALGHSRKRMQEFIYRLSSRMVEVRLCDVTSLSSSINTGELPEHWIFEGSLTTLVNLMNRTELLFSAQYSWTILTQESIETILQMVQPGHNTRMVFVRPEWEPYYACLCPFPSCSCTLETAKEAVLIDAMLILLEKLKTTLSDTSANTTVECLRIGVPPNESPLTLKMTIPGCVGGDIRRRNPFVMEYGMYAMMKSQAGLLERVGSWDIVSGFNFRDDTLYSNIHFDFGFREIVVTATEGPPFIMFYEEDGVRKHRGFSIDMLNELAYRMKFNYTIQEPDDNYYGAPNPDGTWNGMVGMVYRREAEMAIGPITITSLRQQVVDFTKPFIEGSTGILTRSPGFEGGKSIFQTLKPFSITVWLGICGAILLTAVVSNFVNSYTPYESDTVNQRHAKDMKSLAGNFWMIYASITEQGIENHPQSISARCVLGYWWIFTILLVASFTANLTAVLTVFIPPSPIGSLRQLLDQDVVQPIVQAGTSFESLFKNSTDDTYQEIWNRLKDSPRIPFQNAIIEEVKTGKYAYIADTPLTNYIASLNCQNFAVAEQSFDNVGYGIIIPKSAPYTDTINFLVIKMQESGLIEKWRRRWWSSEANCQSVSQSTSRLGLDSLGGIFLLYLGAVALSGISHIVEIILKRNTQKKKT